MKKRRQILTKYRKHLELLAITLLEYETLSGEDINILLKEGKLDRVKPSYLSTPPSSSIPSGGNKSKKEVKKSSSKKAVKQSPEPQVQ